MLQMLDMAAKRREVALMAGRGTAKDGKSTAKDLCGYDTRMDTVGAIHAFSVFLKSEEGEAIFSKGRLEAPLDVLALLSSQVHVKREDGEDDQDNGDVKEEEEADAEDDGSVDGVNCRDRRNGINRAPKIDPLTAGMCTKKKCKTHSGWMGILSKNVKHTMRELAADAKAKLDTETRVRVNAAGRYRRKMKEDNRVVVLYHSSDEEMSDGDEDMGGQ